MIKLEKGTIYLYGQEFFSISIAEESPDSPQASIYQEHAEIKLNQVRRV
jgi:hypothetical protein